MKFIVKLLPMEIADEMRPVWRSFRAKFLLLVMQYFKCVQWQHERKRKKLRALHLGREVAAPFRERSVVFVHQSYYHFYYLARALRKRGWKALLVTYENPSSPWMKYCHGQDLSLFDSDGSTFAKNVAAFYAEAVNEYSLAHFAGDGYLSFFPENWDKAASAIPKDIVDWKNRGKKIAYTISGCSSAVAQSSVAAWSLLDASQTAEVCSKCVWKENREVCSDELNLSWGKKVNQYCDLICAETGPALDYLDKRQTFFEPLTMCLDPEVWSPDLEIPYQFKLEKSEGELLVYHGVGQYQMRTKRDGQNIKGTQAVLRAIEQLQNEGIKVRIIFPEEVENWNVRYLQSQADLVVDQLNLGRYGATARESMMLGKPTICYMNLHEVKACQKVYCFDELPLISATEETIYAVLKDLLTNAEKRRIIGQKSREYAVKWHGADQCAERYEAVYDSLFGWR